MHKYNHPVKNSLNFRHPSGGWEFPVFGTMSGCPSSIVYCVSSSKRSGFVKLKSSKHVEETFVPSVFDQYVI